MSLITWGRSNTEHLTCGNTLAMALAELPFPPPTSTSVPMPSNTSLHRVTTKSSVSWLSDPSPSMKTLLTCGSRCHASHWSMSCAILKGVSAAASSSPLNHPGRCMAAPTWYLLVWESTNGARLVHPLTRTSSTRRRDSGVRRYTLLCPAVTSTGVSRARIPVTTRNLMRRGR
uniref:Uncharacterized protein n=1 Tax=Arundo donax TaxID=35708 RepID=A0A0A9C6R0_ARUDO